MEIQAFFFSLLVWVCFWSIAHSQDFSRLLFNFQTVFEMGLNIIYLMRSFHGAIFSGFFNSVTVKLGWFASPQWLKNYFLNEHQNTSCKFLANCNVQSSLVCGWGLWYGVLSHQIPCDVPSASRLFWIFLSFAFSPLTSFCSEHYSL